MNQVPEKKAIFWSVTVYNKNLSSQWKFTAETEAQEDKINKNIIGGVIVRCNSKV
jgi:hypothetical protein